MQQNDKLRNYTSKLVVEPVSNSQSLAQESPKQQRADPFEKRAYKNRNIENNLEKKGDLPEKDNSSFLRICTHNVRGINKTTDQDNILQELKKQEIDILGLSETKLTTRAAIFSFKD